MLTGICAAAAFMMKKKINFKNLPTQVLLLNNKHIEPPALPKLIFQSYRRVAIALLEDLGNVD